MKVDTPRFFDWTQYPSKTPPELNSPQSSVNSVIIAGAGPVGLTLALTLAQQEIPVVVLEAKNHLSDNSRTLAVARRSVQILDRLGLASAFRELAITRERNLVYHGTQLVHSAAYEQLSTEKHPDISVLQQPWTEKVLLDAVLAHPLIDLRWLNAVSNVIAAEGTDPTVEVTSPEGTYCLQARYVVAADGARGQVRRSLGLRYEEIGDGVLQRNFIICDFELASDLPIDRRLWICPPYKPNSAVILHRQPFDTWRLDYALDDDEDLDEAMKPDTVARHIKAQLELLDMPNADDFRLVWISSYRPMSRTLPNYRHNSVFFVGDAAHQTPIFGGRGMNQGMLDAANLGWKLGFVLKGLTDPGLLESYDAERRPLIIENLKDIGLATLCMTAPTRGAAIMRKAAFDLLPTEPFVLGLIDAFNANKSDSIFASKTHETAHTALPGYPLPDCHILSNAHNIFLHDLLKSHAFTSLYFTAGDDRPSADLTLALNELETQYGEHFHHAWVTAHGATKDTATLADDSGETRLGLQDGTWLLIRPDGYIQARIEQPDGARIADAMRRAVGR